jgi:hypothetical protein
VLVAYFYPFMGILFPDVLADIAPARGGLRESIGQPPDER